ncbi:hypothetical protein [Vibrio sp.]|uniref:hypothetical protein n=1 Tax=Vibrio sp. TaxID=678 RepID=UPI003D0C4A0D
MGVIQAVDKAHKVKKALDTIPTVSEFCQWYDTEILGKNTQENDLRTYRDIFKILEDRYFAGSHRNTGKPRSRDDLGCQRSFDRVYSDVFRLFPDWDSYPNWESMKNAIYTPLETGEPLENSKTLKERVYRCKAIARLSPSSKTLLEKLDEIDVKQRRFREKQTITREAFLNWWVKTEEAIPSLRTKKDRQARQSWLWVAAAAVLYGLRPSEIAAAVNLTKPYKINGEIIPALNDTSNKKCYLVLGDMTYFHVSIKTGGRIIAPVPSFELIELLKLKFPRLPIYTPQPGSKPKTICQGFDDSFSKRMKNAGCPVSEKYAFRRLYNLLCEKYGVPQELRARMMGHSTIVNESKYKTEGISATLEVLNGSARSPLSYNLALERLREAGIDPELPEVKAILRIIYRLDE